MSESQTLPSADEPERRQIIVEVRQQGAPVVNVDTAHLHAGGGDCVAILVDMRSKRCEIITADADEDGIPTVYFQATDGSLHLDESKNRDSFTVIALPEFKGWDFFLAEGGGRYTVRLVLTKGKDGASFPSAPMKAQEQNNA